jgi:hypothetical protein
MSSMAFSGGLAGLAEGTTTEGHENRNQNSNNQNYFTYRNGNTLHHFSLLSARAIFYYPGSKKRTLDYKSIIQVAGIIVNEKRARIGPEICKKMRIFILFREVVLLFSYENQQLLRKTIL